MNWIPTTKKLICKWPFSLYICMFVHHASKNWILYKILAEKSQTSFKIILKWKFLVKFTFKFNIFGLTSWSCGSWNRISTFVFQLKGLVVRSIAPKNQVCFIRRFFFFLCCRFFIEKRKRKGGERESIWQMHVSKCFAKCSQCNLIFLVNP